MKLVEVSQIMEQMSWLNKGQLLHYIAGFMSERDGWDDFSDAFVSGAVALGLMEETEAKE